MSDFDWYSATLSDESLMTGVDALLALSDEAPELVRGRLGYSHGFALSREGARFATVYRGSGLLDHVVATGGDAPEVARTLRLRVPGHAVSRADVKVDFCAGPRFFAETRDLIRSELRGRVTLTRYEEEAPKGTSETLYVGSRTSETRMRLYEKGKESPDLYPPDTVRMELQVRPAKAERKVLAGTLEPDDFWGFARWSRAVLEAVVGLGAPVLPPQHVRVSDVDRSLDAVALQYGKVFVRSLERHGGDLDAFARDLLSRVPGFVIGGLE